MWRGLTFLLPFLFCGHVSPLVWADPGSGRPLGSCTSTSLAPIGFWGWNGSLESQMRADSFWGGLES